MRTNFKARKCTLKQTFIDRAENKLAKVYRFLGDNSTADVMVSKDGDSQKVEITVKDGSLILRAEETAQDRLDALDKAVDSIIRKIRKNKTRIEKKLKIEPTDKYWEDSGEKVYEETYDIAREKRVQMKPQFVEEAMLQMNLLDHNFYMFLNAETEEINVLYKRNDGKYGLLMAEML